MNHKPELLDTVSAFPPGAGRPGGRAQPARRQERGGVASHMKCSLARAL